MRVKLRLNPSAQTYWDVKDYYSVRAMQTYLSDFIWTGKVSYLVDLPVYHTEFVFMGEEYSSFYIPASSRGQGVGKKLSELILGRGLKIMTHPDCKITDWLIKNNIEHHVLNNVSTSLEYQLISDSFQMMYAKRSGVHYMNHIDEGLMVLKDIGASEDAMKAFCLHPLVQMDDALLETFDTLSSNSLIQRPLALAMEYRSVANKWLSNKVQGGWFTTSPTLSPLKEVNDMLIADKLQNYKDFLLYHKKTHKRSEDLEIYFHSWLNALGMPIRKTQDLMQNILKLQKGEHEND